MGQNRQWKCNSCKSGSTRWGGLLPIKSVGRSRANCRHPNHISFEIGKRITGLERTWFAPVHSLSSSYLMVHNRADLRMFAGKPNITGSSAIL
jgi:hypothetical protein